MDKWKVLVLCKLACAAYNNDLGVVNTNLEEGLVLHSTFKNDESSAEGFFAVNRSKKCIYLVFKGSKEIKDFLVDAEVLMEPLEKYSPKFLVHIGFQDALMSVMPQLNAFPFKDFGGYEIYITGHSLGGALATLATLLVTLPQNATLVTFGSPRVGNHEFCSAVRGLTCESIRVVHEDDVVTLVPGGQYDHVDGRLHLDTNGNEIGTLNVIKRIVYWWKGKANLKLFSIDDHKVRLYLESVTNWQNK